MWPQHDIVHCQFCVMFQISPKSVNICQSYSLFSKIQYGGHHYLEFYNPLSLSRISDVTFFLNQPAKFDVNRKISNEMAARCVKFQMSVAAILDFGYNFWFHIFLLGMLVWICISNFIKIGQYLPKLQPVFENPIWRPPPCWILQSTSAFKIFRCNIFCWISLQNLI